jgi:hypothetical protein
MPQSQKMKGGKIMSCYLRHLQDVAVQAGLTTEKEDRKLMDKLVRKWAGQEGVKCNLAWKEIKAKIAAEGENSLVNYINKQKSAG